MSISDRDSDNESFKSVKSRSNSPTRTTQNGIHPAPSEVKEEPQEAEEDHFSPEEEARLLSESNDLKASGNSMFGKGSYSEAIPIYDRALSSVPNYLDYELAVLRSNIAACHIKLAEWKEAIDSATKAADNLEHLDPLPRPKPSGKDSDPKTGNATSPTVTPSQIEEVDDATEKAIARLAKSGHPLSDIQKLRIKILSRRAKARTELGGWSSLEGAREDYTFLMGAPGMSDADRRAAQGALAALGPRLEEAKQREMAEMMGKLKGLGNSILKPFGLSTENFQFVKGEGGGYSMNFTQNPGTKG